LGLLADGTMIAFRGFALFSQDKKGGRWRKVARIPGISLLKRLASRFSLLCRLFRLYPRCSEIVNGNLFFAVCGYCYVFDVVEHRFLRIEPFRPGMTAPLALAPFQNGVLFGDYFGNPDKLPVFLRFVSPSFSVSLASFSGVRHIHCVIASDQSPNLFFVFTGDEDNEVKIYEVCINPTNLGDVQLRTIVGGSQKYRSCCGVISSGFLFYATDTPYLRNGLFRVGISGSETPDLLAPLSGTTIYGHQNAAGLLFSTAVEHNLAKNNDGTNKRIPIDGKAGGVLSKNSFLYYLPRDGKELLFVDSGKKDIWHHYFGFGTFLFASTQNPSVFVYYSLALVGHKNRIVRLSIR